MTDDQKLLSANKVKWDEYESLIYKVPEILAAFQSFSALVDYKNYSFEVASHSQGEEAFDKIRPMLHYSRLNFGYSKGIEAIVSKIAMARFYGFSLLEFRLKPDENGHQCIDFLKPIPCDEVIKWILDKKNNQILEFHCGDPMKPTIIPRKFAIFANRGNVTSELTKMGLLHEIKSVAVKLHKCKIDIQNELQNQVEQGNSTDAVDLKKINEYSSDHYFLRKKITSLLGIEHLYTEIKSKDPVEIERENWEFLKKKWKYLDIINDCITESLQTIRRDLIQNLSIANSLEPESAPILEFKKLEPDLNEQIQAFKRMEKLVNEGLLQASDPIFSDAEEILRVRATESNEHKFIIEHRNILPNDISYNDISYVLEVLNRAHIKRG